MSEDYHIYQKQDSHSGDRKHRHYQHQPSHEHAWRKRDHSQERNYTARRSYHEAGDDSDRPQSKRKKKYYGGADETAIERVEYHRQNWKPVFDDLSSNPHILQVELNLKSNYVSETNIPFERILTDDSPQTPYRRRRHEVKTVIHWGQRKLLMSEIEFLLRFGSLSNLIVYAGAAPGTHIAQLSDMFPNHRFVCVDPAPFSPYLSSHDSLLLRQEKFTDALALEYANRDVLFISDIRSVDPDLTTDKETDKAVRDDQDAQMRWHDIIHPVASMLKFRLPWCKGKTEYLDGDIYFPVWGPITTTEARLMVTGNKRRLYDNEIYEAQLFHFNTQTRVARYMHDVVGEGIDYCYDCKAEVEILREYLIKEKKIDPNDTSINHRVSSLSKQISRSLGHRTLQDANADPLERKQGIAKSQWISGKPAYMDRVEHVPTYSNVSKKIMERMGHIKGDGLGSKTKGIVDPINPLSQHNKHGLGFTPAEFDFDGSTSFVQKNCTSSYPTTPTIANDQRVHQALRSSEGHDKIDGGVQKGFGDHLEMDQSCTSDTNRQANKPLQLESSKEPISSIDSSTAAHGTETETDSNTNE